MQTDQNPYAPPSARIASDDLASCGDGFCWREGDKLVVFKEKPLPCRCIKCNAPGSIAKVRRFYWVTASVYLPLVLMIFIPLLAPVFS